MSDDAKKPSVLIVGAGLGGVLLGALLEKANIPYTIFERSSRVKPLGEIQYILSRPLLYNILVKLIPPHKIQFGKRFLMTKQIEDNQRVSIQTSDNSVYEGDILVGADGAYSAVRQRLYETLKKEGKLPKSDQEELPFSCTCLVGQTQVLDLEEFPQLKDPLIRSSAPWATTSHIL
ncbi:hypothetical protein BGZ88_010689, partial [Linnemannia elongata]